MLVLNTINVTCDSVCLRTSCKQESNTLQYLTSALSGAIDVDLDHAYEYAAISHDQRRGLGEEGKVLLIHKSGKSMMIIGHVSDPIYQDIGTQ